MPAGRRSRITFLRQVRLTAFQVNTLESRSAVAMEECMEPACSYGRLAMPFIAHNEARARRPTERMSQVVTPTDCLRFGKPFPKIFVYVLQVLTWLRLAISCKRIPA
jgi:hypothetical protein